MLHEVQEYRTIARVGPDSAIVQAIGHTPARVIPINNSYDSNYNYSQKQQEWAVTDWQRLYQGNTPCTMRGLIHLHPDMLNKETFMLNRTVEQLVMLKQHEV